MRLAFIYISFNLTNIVLYVIILLYKIVILLVKMVIALVIMKVNKNITVPRH